MSILKKITFLITILISLQLTAQDKQVHGYVLDAISQKPVANAKITELKSGTYVLTDSSGLFNLSLPKKTRELIITHENYKPFKQLLHPLKSTRELIFKITPYNHKQSDTIWRNYKNAITLSPMELINGAVAVRYERFLKLKHSVGLHSSVYLFGFNSWVFNQGYNSARFTGIRLTPFYRYYPIRSNAHGFFLEGKVSYGYFNFSSITYIYSNYYTKKKGDTFSTFGGGVAIGWMFRLPKTKHGVGNFSIGLQTFPFAGNTSIQADRGDGEMVTWTTDTSWWYIWSPGAVFEFKFTIGGIF